MQGSALPQTGQFHGSERRMPRPLPLRSAVFSGFCRAFPPAQIGPQSLGQTIFPAAFARLLRRLALAGGLIVGFRCNALVLLIFFAHCAAHAERDNYPCLATGRMAAKTRNSLYAPLPPSAGGAIPQTFNIQPGSLMSIRGRWHTGFGQGLSEAESSCGRTPNFIPSATPPREQQALKRQSSGILANAR